MKHYTYITPDNNLNTCKSQSESNFALLWKRAGGEWTSIAGARYHTDILAALEYKTKAFTVKGEFAIVEQTEVTPFEWEIANNAYLARVRSTTKAGA